MKKYKPPLLMITIGLLIVVIHSAALLYSLYFLFWWLDIVIHFLAGVLISLFVMWMYQKRIKYQERLEYDLTFLFNIFLFALILGFVWESFELLNL